MRNLTKAIALVILLTSTAFGVLAQKKAKIIDSSAKKKPAWVNTLVKDYIIVTASSNTLEDAQEKALAKVKERIISSVAENIQTESEYFRSETVHNNDADFKEKFETATKTRAADIPFIKGISLSKVDAFYWEKESFKDNIKFYYHIKYPFNAAQLKKLIYEFEKADQELTDRLNSLLKKAENIESLEMMSQTEKELQALSDGFLDVDPRKDKANVGIAKLKDMMKNFSIETVSSTLGEIHVVLKVGEQTITTARKPKVTSNCAKIVEVKSKTPEWIIKYNYDECYDDPDNSVNIIFRSAYGKAKNEYFFNINADKIDIFVNDDINISGGEDNGIEIKNATGTISLTSKYDSGFTIEKIILNFGKEAPIIIDNINQTYTGKGKHTLSFTIPQSLNKDIYNSRSYDMIKGSIHYKSVKTGEKSIYKMFNQNITTSW